MFYNYLKVAIRNILRSKVFSVINILGLAVSMSICLLVIKMIFGMYSCDRFHENKDRIYRVITFERGEGYGGYELATTPDPLAGEIGKLSGVEKVVKVRSDFGGDVFWNDKVVPISGLFSDPEFFEVFSFTLDRGDPQTALKDPYSIVVTPEWASKMFGDEDPMGQTISLMKLGEYKITGITQSISHLKTHLSYECIASSSTLVSLENQEIKSKTIDNWENPYRTYTFFMLEKGAKTNSVESAFPGIIDTYVPKSDRYFEYRLQRLTDISPGKRLSNQMGNPSEPAMAYVLVIVALILILTASFTYTTLSVARAFNRAREVGVRKVFGANRSQLFAQFIGEAVVLSIIALNFAYIILIFLEPKLFHLDPHFDQVFGLAKTPVVIYVAFILFTIILGIITGIFPAIYLSRFRPVDVFKDLSKVKLFSRTNLRKVLIVVQFTISLFLVFAVIIADRQVKYEKGVDLGYNIENVFIVELQEMNYPVFKNELIQLSGVESVSATGYIPATGVVMRSFIQCEKIPDSTVISILTVDPDFISMMEMKMISGEDFGILSLTNPGNYAIINQAAVHHLEFSNPEEALEYSVSMEGEEGIQIIGVIENFIIQGFEMEPDPLIIRVIPRNFNYAFVKIRSGHNLSDVIKGVESSWKKLNPRELFRSKLYSEHIENYMVGAEQMVIVLGFITFLTLFISILGLLGMVVFSNENRVNEIGIRKVAGSDNLKILWTISKSFIFMMGLAVLVATPLAWFIARMLLQNIYNRVPLRPEFFIVGIIFLLIIGGLTIFSQTWKAANKNPVESLRYE